MVVMKDYYAILEVSPTASQREIQEQYRFLLQAWHPDKFPNSSQKAKAEERVKDLNEAYAVLSDPIKRSAYERQQKFNSPYTTSTRSNQAYQRPVDPPVQDIKTHQTAAQKRRAADEQLGYGCIYIYIMIAAILEFIAMRVFRMYSPVTILVVLILAGLITIPLTFELDDFLNKHD